MRSFSSGLLVALFLSLAAAGRAAAPASVRLEFELLPRGGASEAWSGRLTLRPKDPAARPIELAVASGTVVSAVPAGSAWTAHLDLPGRWSAVQEIETELSERDVLYRLFVWPAAEVRGKLSVADPGDTVPKRLGIAVLPTRKGGHPGEEPRGDAECPVDESGAFRCRLPSGRRDLSLRAEGFAPMYRLGIGLPPGPPVELGALALRRGASLAGWVEVEGSLDPKTCRVELAPWAAPGAAGKAGAQLATARQSVAVGRDGFFQLVGVTPGTYSIVARQPGFASAVVAPFALLDATATRLPQPLRLRPPLRLALTLDPPRDWLGRPWRVDIWRGSDFGGGYGRQPVHRGPADGEGTVRVAGQAPGTFSIEVADSLGNRFYSEGDLAILTSADAERRIKLDMVALTGRVTLGDEPLAATLWFGGRYGARSVRLEADGEGRFHGALPKEGLWRVAIEAAKPALQLERQIEVLAGGDGLAEVEIDLPDTLVFGSVLDEDDRPAPGASVEAEGKGDRALLDAGADGRFELRGFTAGPLALAAKEAGARQPRTSEVQHETLKESEALGPLVLRLRSGRRIEGQVVGDTGPVAGASLMILPQGTAAGASTARTSFDGRFEATLPASSQRAEIVVGPPGHALRAFEVPIQGAPITLRVSGAGGTLEVAVPGPAQEIERRGLLLQVFQDGLLLPTPELHRWSVGLGQSPILEGGALLRFPQLGEAQIHACLVPRAVLLDPAGRTAGPAGACAEGRLTAGGTLRLELRLEEKARSEGLDLE